RLGPPPGTGQVVPLRDQVAQRAALVAERDAAVHAAAGLAGQRRRVLLAAGIDLLEIHQPYRDRAAGRQLAVTDLEKSAWVSHGSPPVLGSRPRVRLRPPLQLVRPPARRSPAHRLVAARA